MTRTDISEPTLQRRTLGLLSLAQIFSGIGTGAVVSTGSLLAVELSGSDAWAGSVTTTMTLGAAAASALLMRVALAHGRRPALSLGLGIAALGAIGIVVAATLGWFWLLVASGVLIGFGNAVNLQARFAATDLSSSSHRARDLSLIVWMSTIGAVAGPNLIGAGELLAEPLGIPGLAGLFVISAAGMLMGMLIIALGLRPDPYVVLAAREDQASTPAQRRIRDGVAALLRYPNARRGMIAILAAHAVMVAVMSMTPVHLVNTGASVSIIGVTVSLHIAGMYALAPVMGILSDRWGGQRVAVAGLLVTLASALLSGLSGTSHITTLLGLILLGLGWSAATVAGAGLIVGAIPINQRLAAQGASDMLMSLSGALGGLLAGVALALIGYAGLGIAAALVTAAAVILLIFGRRAD